MILSVLEKTLFKPPSHIMLREVRNATGYARGVTRTADALVVSVWPSRGIWLACVEVKEHRSDWLRELKDPAKAEEISRFCQFMWIATPPGIVLKHELPVNWGLVEVHKSKMKVVKPAPKRTATALSPAFVAAVLRNRADYESSLRGRVKEELEREAMNAESVGTDVAALRRVVESQKSAFEAQAMQLQALKQTVETFERASGLHLASWNAQELGAAVKLAESFNAGQLSNLADQFERIAKLARKAHGELAQLQLSLGEASS